MDGIKTVLITLSAGFSAAAMLAAPGTSHALDGDWEFALSPLFLWGVSVDGDSTIAGNEAPLDLDFTDDILDNMEAVFTLHFEARRHRLALFTEYQYIDLEPNTNATSGPVAVSADIDFEEALWEIGAAWNLTPDNREMRFELIGGARYTDQDVNVNLDLTTPVPGLQPGQTIKGGDDWWHGFAGVRIWYRLSEKWTVISRLDGGYGGSDNSALNFSFLFDWRFNEWGSAFFGGRYLSYDYESSDYGYDAAKQGPLAGLTIHW